MYKLKLVYRSDNSDNGPEVEHESTYLDIEEAIEEANDLAFNTTGFNIESWEYVASFGDEGGLYYFYPVDEDHATKYVMRVFKLFDK